MSQPTPKAQVAIKGNTLRVYLYLLRSGPSELRDVQRSLGFSSPSLASYHLAKLADAGYVSQDEHGRYIIASDATMELLDGYTRIGTVVFPQLFFVSILFTAVVGFLAATSLFNSAYVPLLVIASVAMLGAFWFETIKVWRRLTSWK